MIHLVGISGLSDDGNLGDAVCQPLKYVGPPPGVEVDDLGQFGPGAVVHKRFPRNTVVVVGGGGMLDGGMGEARIGRLVAMRQRGELAGVVYWGIGQNVPIHRAESYRCPKWLDDADLVGVRCGSCKRRFVPCPTCMAPVFDCQFEQPSHDVVVYGHHKHRIPDINGYPSARSNTFSTMLEAVSFLARGRTVVTNSYHGTYWAILLGRRVVVVGPWSTKFTTMPWQPTVGCFGEVDQLLERSVAHEGALEEARGLNRKFAESFQEVVRGADV